MKPFSLPYIKYYLYICFIGVSSLGFSQNISVSGKIVDHATNKSMPGATVILLHPSDSTFYKFNVSNSEGIFNIKGAEAGKYLLQVSYIGYQSFYQDITLTDGENIVEMGNISINVKKELLKSVDVVDELVPVIINGDTVEFNADAFKTQPEANVGDLLKKLPGVEVDKDGTVKAQGEEVKKVLIDGKEFFGDDTKLATENLPADMVKKVQIYDDFSETSKITGIDDGDRTKTINLKIKKDRKKGLFGNVSGAGGSTAKELSDMNNEKGLYNGKFNINKFKENIQLSTLGMLNNTNEQGFSYKDYINFVGGANNAMQGGGYRNTGGSGIPLNSNPNDGFTETAAGGLNWNQDLKNNINLSTSYFYSESSKKIYTEANKQYISDSKDFNSTEKNNENQFNRNHRFKVKYDQEIDSTQDLKFRTNLTFSQGNIYTAGAITSITPEGIFLNSSHNNYQATGTNIDGSAEATYGKRYSKRGRSVVTKISIGNAANDKKYFVESENEFVDTIGNKNLMVMRQIQNETSDQLNYSGKINFTEPIGNRKYLELNYQRKNYNNNYIKDFFDIPLSYTELYNPDLSLNYRNKYIYDSYGIQTKFNNDKSKLTTGIAAQRSNLDGQIISTNFELKRVQWNLLPSIKWNYSFNKSTRFTFHYNTNVQEPSIDQLQPTINNSDPLNLYQGNPNLKTEYRHNANVRIMSFNQFSFTNVFAMINATYTKNKITDSQSLDDQFIQTTSPVNVDNDFLITSYLYYGTPIRALKCKINTRLNSSFNKGILFINTESDNVNRISNGIDFNIENRKKDIFDAKIGSKISWNTTSYSRSNVLDQHYLSTSYYTEFLLEFLKTWTFSTEVEYTLYSGDQFVDNPSIPLWKAYVSKRFLKGNNGLLKLSVYDILNQNIGINRTNELNYVLDERVTTLSRYVMLSFTYKIARFGGKKKKTADPSN